MNDQLIELLEDIKSQLERQLWQDWDHYTDVFITKRTYEDWCKGEENFLLLSRINNQINELEIIDK